MRFLLRTIAVALVLVGLAAVLFAIYVIGGMRSHARYIGTISGLALRAPVSVLRDDRGVPHIIAQDDRDLFFAQGYVEGSDRLFQMDLLRRFTLGELAEVFGPVALKSDEEQRAVPIRAMVERQWRQLDPSSRDIVEAFSRGVNAAMEREPLPVEFRILAYRPKPWTPEDSLAVGMAEVLDLIDDWNQIAARDAAYRHGGRRLLEARFPLTDPCYDAPVTMGLANIARGPNCARNVAMLLRELGDPRPPIGSNEWAVGAKRAVNRRALLANDPHLGLGIPGVWYLVDLHSPSYHVTGASLPGLPAVVLGHNERIAWGATAGTVTSLSVFAPPAHLDPSGWQTERFAVRFLASATERYYRAKRLFGLTTDDGRFVLVRWNAYDRPFSAAQTFIGLDRATSIEAATAALAAFPCPSLNFVLADTTGRAAYVLAGEIPNDPARGRWIHPASDLYRNYPAIPFSALPKVAPSQNAVVWSANNKMYGGNYPFDLSPQFVPPYRAYRIAQLLRARAQYDLPYFVRMQLDAISLPERELAHDLAPAIGRNNAAIADALARWNGSMDGDSTTATVIEGLRWELTDGHTGRMPTLLGAGVTGDVLRPIRPLPKSPPPWGIAGAVTVRHSLAALGINFLNGTTLPGYGDSFTLHVQYPSYSQSFRAVWDVGNWDEGGITLPQGESGEPGSGHYTDEAAAWLAGRLWPLPFSDAAVGRTAVERETLSP
ncbi:MAG: penicillin acylase family protein [Candidatus Eremiobacteraeota bacterium]|nr:penicillin acylase family protein [Candidatus Eremiobacteraeota bacterium]